MPLSKIDSDSLNSGLTFSGQQTIPTINLTGGQITFPATAVPSANANTLDDYEEGSWTPRLTGTGGGDYTPGGVNAARYVKVGRVVFATCTLSWAARVTPYSGSLMVAGLPFACGSNRAVGSIGAVSGGLTFNAGYSQWTYLVDPNNTSVYIIEGSTSGSGYTHSPVVAVSGLVYAMTVIYEASA